MNRITTPISERFLPLHLDNLVNPVPLVVSLRQITDD